MQPYALCGICYRSVTVRHKPVFYRNVWVDRDGVRHSGYSTLCYNGIRLSPKLRLLPTGTLSHSQTLNLADFSAFSPWRVSPWHCGIVALVCGRLQVKCCQLRSFVASLSQ